MSEGIWQRVCVTSFLLLLLSGWLGNALERRNSPLGNIGLALLGLSLLAFIVSVPPVAVRTFLVAQTRIGNGDKPLVKFLSVHERGAVRLVWSIWALGALIASPFVPRDLAVLPLNLRW
jgi:hypothetical protein